jgi:2-iminobutanoate/2-iminopropanoate deaminase
MGFRGEGPSRGERPGTGVSRRSVNPVGVADTLQYGFSQAVVVEGGRRVHLSGQVGVDADERTVGPDLESQTRAALDNIATILGEVGGDLSHVVVLRLYIVESARGDQRFIGRALRERFPADPPPARREPDLKWSTNGTDHEVRIPAHVGRRVDLAPAS